MKKFKKLLMLSGLCAMLVGCGANGNADVAKKSVNENVQETGLESTQTGKTEDKKADDKKTEDKENGTEISVEVTESETNWPAEEIQKEIKYLEENFGYELEFEDMDDEMAESYGEAIATYYDFVGRVTDDGIGYVLGFKKGEEDPFEGYEQFWHNHEFVIAERDEKTYEETIIYSLDQIEDIYVGENHDVLYIQPNDMEAPEEIMEAFVENYLWGEEGRSYLADVLERGVRFTPPDSGAYLEVWRYENGRQRLEHIPLTDEEEKRILQSDALILPEWYGYYGLKFYVSTETYEETGQEQGAITYEALRIAEERCRFVGMDISEIHDIVNARLELHLLNGGHEENPEPVIITDEKLLKELEDIFSSAEFTGEGKCPYWGILTLTRADGKELVLSLAIDSCDGFVYGSSGFYSMGKKNAERVWEIFSELRPYTGWVAQ